jgi:hypothetical protein
MFQDKMHLVFNIIQPRKRKWRTRNAEKCLKLFKTTIVALLGRTGGWQRYAA